MLGDDVDEVVGLFGLVGVAEALHDVGEAHQTQTNGTVLLVGEVSFVNRGTSDVDQVVELANSKLGAFCELGEVNLVVVSEVTREVDRSQVTYRDVVLVLRQRDFGAEVRGVDGAGVVVEGTQVDGVLPGQPGVAGGLKGDQDLLELLACTNLLVEVDAASFCLSYVEVVALGEGLAVKLVEVGDLEWVEEVPVVIVLDTLHELVRNPDSGVRGTGTTVGVTRVLTQVKELGEVHVPVLHVEAESTELLTTTADRTKDRVNGVHEGDRTGRSGVVRTDR